MVRFILDTRHAKMGLDMKSFSVPSEHMQLSAEVQYCTHMNLKSLITIQDTFNGLITDSRTALFLSPMQFTKQMKDTL